MVDNLRSEPAPGLKGDCPLCSAPMLAKCGERVLWHWAHRGRRHCDSWWESETPWHRTWKARFPEANREVVQFDDRSGEKHVADVKTDAGVLLEFQNSPMAATELERPQDHGTRERSSEARTARSSSARPESSTHPRGARLATRCGCCPCPPSLCGTGRSHPDRPYTTPRPDWSRQA